MYRISSNIDQGGKGFFTMAQEKKTLGKIKVKLGDGELILLDTIVPDHHHLKFIGAQLVDEIVGYARLHELKIITISKFVQKQFSRNPELYADVWEKAY